MGKFKTSLEGLVLMLEVYQGKKVFITGHTGFKGSWLTLWLEKLGAELTGFSLAPKTEKDNFVLSGVQNRIQHIEGDITDLPALEKAIDEAKPDFVFHLAAQALVGPAYSDPVGTWKTNVLGSIHVLESIRKVNPNCTTIMITSDKCYENVEWQYGYREIDTLGGKDPYSSSKAACEIAIHSWRHSFLGGSSAPIASTRAGNVIGGGDWNEKRIVPDAIRSLEKNESLELRSPQATRPWQHVLSPLSGYLLLGERLSKDPEAFSSAWNFGPIPGTTAPVSQLVDRIHHYWGSGSWRDISNQESFHEAGLLALDISKAMNLLGWHPVWDLEKTLEKTVEWYKDYSKADVTQLCQQQIESFTEDWKSI